jgi:hypothetical protein
MAIVGAKTPCSTLNAQAVGRFPAESGHLWSVSSLNLGCERVVWLTPDVLEGRYQQGWTDECPPKRGIVSQSADVWREGLPVVVSWCRREPDSWTIATYRLMVRPRHLIGLAMRFLRGDSLGSNERLTFESNRPLDNTQQGGRADLV